MNNGVLNQTINFDGAVQIEVQEHEYIINNFNTIQFKAGNSATEINLSKGDYNELGQKMFPDGLIPDDFHKKIAMLNQLIEELEIRDKENPDWKLSNIKYIGGEDDIVTFDCKVVE
jgi:hypothetical protein